MTIAKNEMKKSFFILIVPIMLLSQVLPGQDSKEEGKHTKAIHALIDQYSLARDTKDSVLLKSILTEDVDQLVSTGEWRKGVFMINS
jgi:hypothetical protein